MRQPFFFLWLMFLGLGVGACQELPVKPLPTRAATAVPLHSRPDTVTPSAAPVQATSLPQGSEAVTELEVSAATPYPTPTRLPFENRLDSNVAAIAKTLPALFVPISPENSGFWPFAPQKVSHPLAIQLHGIDLYLLDAGRVLRFDIEAASMPEIILSNNTMVESVPVLEPIDLYTTATTLFVLDRSGDVYSYDFVTATWRIDWYGRRLEESSGHYYVALTAQLEHQLLLETSYYFVQRYGASERIWPIPEQIGVDIVEKEMTYVLQQTYDSNEGLLQRYHETALDPSLQPNVSLSQVRQLLVTDDAIYILDWAGQRLLHLDKKGQVQRIFQPPIATQTVWVAGHDSIIFATPDGIYWFGRPGDGQTIPQYIAPKRLRFFSDAEPKWDFPVTGTDLSERQLRLPGAPRHYRLGVHEGLDFYWRAGSPVWAVADGVVVRATVNYERPLRRHFNQWRTASFELGKTAIEALDFYRGRQVWLAHEDGTITRYAHLSKIAPEVVMGAQIAQGQIIGEVGNSGSPASINDENSDATSILKYGRMMSIWANISGL